MKHHYTESFIGEIIQMAWADEVSFDAIYASKGVSEAEVIALMRENLKAGSFKLWRKRVSGRNSKHEKRARLMQQESA